MTKKNLFQFFSWGFVFISYAASLIVNPLARNTQPVLVFLLALPLALVHGIRRYGWKGMGVYAGVTYIISTFWESLSIHTGFPFGSYHYSFHPQILGVPLLIGPAYISLGYISWQVANAILQEADARIERLSTAVLVATFSGIAMTVYDLATDITASTVGHGWVWHEGGAFFGVPVSNFLGWWFCTFTFYAVFASFLNRKSTLINHEGDRTSLLQFILIYANLGITVVVNHMLQLTGTMQVKDMTGSVWNTSDISGSSLLWVVFGMFPLALIAVINLYRIGLPDN